MALWHKCHTCGTKYECTAKWCPGCGKRLGHKEKRPQEACKIIYERNHGEIWGKCSNCNELVFKLGSEDYAKYCPNCGAYAITDKKALEINMTLDEAISKLFDSFESADKP